MNILNNDQLRSLLKLSEIQNTINGGTVSTNIKTVTTEDSVAILIKAPSVNPEAFQVVLNERELVVFSIVQLGAEEKSADELMAVPMFLKTFLVPAEVDTDQIEAIHEEGELKIILPFHQQMKKKLRQIKIKQV